MLKEMLYAGIGLATVTKEKAEEIIVDLIKKGEISTEEGKDLLSNLMSRMQEESDKLKYTIDKQVEKVISSMNLVRKSEFDKLVQKLEELENKITQIIDKKEV